MVHLTFLRHTLLIGLCPYLGESGEGHVIFSIWALFYNNSIHWVNSDVLKIKYNFKNYETLQREASEKVINRKDTKE